MGAHCQHDAVDAPPKEGIDRYMDGSPEFFGSFLFRETPEFRKTLPLRGLDSARRAKHPLFGEREREGV